VNTEALGEWGRRDPEFLADPENLTELLCDSVRRHPKRNSERSSEPHFRGLSQR
jgi:hypothetical protein